MTELEFFDSLKKSEAGQNYLTIVLSRAGRKIEQKIPGFEKHHVFPKSLGGSDSVENISYISVYDHILAHYYLALALPCRETLYALQCIGNLSQFLSLSDLEKLSLTELEHWTALRIKANDIRREKATGRIPSEETRKLWSLQRKGRPAWNRGKKMNLTQEQLASRRQSRRGIKPPNTGKKAVHLYEDQPEIVFVAKEELQGYLDRGYKLGMPKCLVDKGVQKRTGSVRSEETKRKMSEARKLFWQRKKLQNS